ncbi:MAG TPA: T9SS type A sorting domain-containing protein [Saprospiraceae bacterium]|nr:T9SS type A sorting domain-containing protein [Saprospiraceae bacterium]
MNFYIKGKLLICILATCWYVELFGQVRIAVQPGFNSFGGKMQLMPDQSVRVIGIASDDWWYGMSFVSTVHFNTAGQMLSVKMFPEIGLEEAGDLQSFPTREGHTIVVADLTGCDFGVPVTLGCISETDEIVWHRSPFDFEIEVSGPSFQLRQVTDTIFRVWNSQHDEYYSFNGLRVMAPDEYILYDEILLTKNGYAMSRDSVFTICDTTFIPFTQIVLSSEILAFDTITAAGYFCTTSDSLFVLNSSLQILNSKPLPVSEVERVFATSSDFWVVERYTNQFYRLDSLMEVIAMYPLEPRIELSNILHIADTIFVSGNFTGRDRSMVLFRNTPEKFSLNLYTDIGITHIRLTEQATSTNVDWGWGGYPVRNVYYGPVYVTLHNYGPTPIYETFVRFQEYACPSFCEGVLQYEWNLTGLYLSPGESREVFLDNLFFNCTAYPIEHLCLYTFNPNREPDLHYENDPYCVTVDVISAVEDILQDAEVLIYPNPASDVLYIEYLRDFDWSNGEIALINSSGQEVWHKHFGQLVTQISLDGIQPSVYFLLIHVRSEPPVMKKIVVM